MQFSGLVRNEFTAKAFSLFLVCPPYSRRVLSLLLALCYHRRCRRRRRCVCLKGNHGCRFVGYDADDGRIRICCHQSSCLFLPLHALLILLERMHKIAGSTRPKEPFNNIISDARITQTDGGKTNTNAFYHTHTEGIEKEREQQQRKKNR